MQALDGGQERRAFFIGEAISILQRHVLEWRKYRNGLSQKQFNGMWQYHSCVAMATCDCIADVRTSEC